jgi:ribosome-associated translation inhibitor RaiA
LTPAASETKLANERCTQGVAMSEAVIAVHFKDMPVHGGVRDAIEDRCRALAEEFPELTHVEVTLTPDGGGHAASGRVTGRATDLATHAAAAEPGHAADRLLDTLRQQLRRSHDKRVFARRRSAQRENPKRPRRPR